MQEEDVELSLKIIVVGNGTVGKTSLIQRFCKNTYTDQYKKTIGVDFLEKQFLIPSIGENATLMLWDTAGQEEFDGITKNYYKGAVGAIIVFSTTDRASFEAVKTWKSKIEAECPKIAIVLVQNKVDLIDQAVMTPAESEALASSLGLRLHRISVKDNLNINELFEYLSGECVKVKRSGGTSEPSVGGTASSPAPKPANEGAFKLGSNPPETSEKPKKKKSTCSLI